MSASCINWFLKLRIEISFIRTNDDELPTEPIKRFMDTLNEWVKFPEFRWIFFLRPENTKQKSLRHASCVMRLVFHSHSHFMELN